MAARPESHRARGLERRAALLDAAIEVVADHGVAGVTHRAVAARAGFPASTTSYFFASIDDLLLEAMSERIARQVDSLKSLTSLVENQDLDLEMLATAVANAIVDPPVAELIAQFDMYVTAARRDDVRVHVQAMIDAFEDLVTVALDAAGVPDPSDAARALVALADGLTLHRVALGRDRESSVRDLRQALGTMFFAYAQAGEYGSGAADGELRLVED